MFLKSLELNGFKSFAQKTVLDFPTGITAIVGPNGSGKSNIIDAIRWLLGEREAKNLRSAKAEDLIFGGTSSKSRVAMASAGLNFDNNSGFFSVDFKEVSIVRRVGRDGFSQYFLNKAEVKLKNIIDFFSRSRLGTKGLTIINQGEADLFVKASPEERRVMIEEVLGLREYQIKKNEAERKLKNTLINLEKIKAITEEVIPRLRTLKRQTGKWEKREAIQKELNNFENEYFLRKLNEINNNRKASEPLIVSLDNQIRAKEEELKILELELKKIESQPQDYQEIKKIKNEQSRLLAERSFIQRELGRIEARLEFLTAPESSSDKIFKNEDLINFISAAKKTLEVCLANSSIEDLKKTINELISKIDNFFNSEKKSADSSRDLVEASLRDLEKKFGVIEVELKKMEEKEMKIAVNLENFNKKFQKSFELVDLKRREMRDLEKKKSEVLFEEEKFNLKFSELEDQLRQVGKLISDLRPIAEDKNIAGIDFFEIERRMFRLRAELAAIGEIDEFLIKEAKEVEAHYNFLTNQSQDLEKAIIDLKNLIKELSEKIHFEFDDSLKLINEEFDKFFKLMFGGGNAKLKIRNKKLKMKNIEDAEGEVVSSAGIDNSEDDEKDDEVSAGVEIELSLPKKRITSLEMLSGGEKSLVSIAALFALISISPPPFLVLDEIDAALDENNSRRFAGLIKEFSKKTQFIVVTHNRAVMEAANALYGVTAGEDGTSRILSLKLDTEN